MSKQPRTRARRHRDGRRRRAAQSIPAKSAIAREGEAAAKRVRLVIPAHLEGAVVHWSQDRLEEVFGMPA